MKKKIVGELFYIEYGEMPPIGSIVRYVSRHRKYKMWQIRDEALAEDGTTLLAICPTMKQAEELWRRDQDVQWSREIEEENGERYCPAIDRWRY